MAPTTRRQTAIAEGKISPPHDKPRSSSTSGRSRKRASPQSVKSNKTPSARGNTKKKRGTEEAPSEAPASKKVKRDVSPVDDGKEREYRYQTGTIERGHIYFLYRPRVQLTEVNSVDDIQKFHILLVPRPPEFASHGTSQRTEVKKQDPSEDSESEMKVLAPGADAVPASGLVHPKAKSYRLITVGKKQLPSPNDAAEGSTHRKETFWATVTAVGNDFASLDKGLGERSYETKTRGSRHQDPVRLVARGGYAIVNSEAETPSKRETHLGYHVSHPLQADMGDVQKSLGIFSASSFVLQVKNPLAPAANPQQAHSKSAEYPSAIMQDVFGAGIDGQKKTRGREQYGLRFVSCEVPELLDYQGAEILLIAARDGEEGLEKSLGDGRGTALTDKEEEEAHKSVEKVFEELGLDMDQFPVESLEGSWI